MIQKYIITNSMLETPHVIVGAAIATKIGNPALAIPLAFCSHFVLELVPHWNPHLNTEKGKHGRLTNLTLAIVIGDVLTSLFLGGYIAFSYLPNIYMVFTILASCLAAVLPDLVEAPYFLFNQRSSFIEKKWIPFKKSLQNDTNPVLGLATQLITIIAAFFWIYS